MGALMEREETVTRHKTSELARTFGSLIRSRRRSLDMSQDQVALVTGVGRRFLIDLEAGKPSCQLGRSLLVAEALGLELNEILATDKRQSAASVPELSDLLDEDGR
jgi:transcriptional regulator with XRE-family HTH domain